jgi:RNA polymerase sigma factor (TIGR02999 family)
MSSLSFLNAFIGERAKPGPKNRTAATIFSRKVGCYTSRAYERTGAFVDKQSTGDVTALLVAWKEGDEEALNQLIPLVHQELHRLARSYMAREGPGHSLQASALVNEAYLKLVDNRRAQWQNRAHFFGVSAQLMRRILVDFARKRHYQKRGGGAQQVTLVDELAVAGKESSDVVVIDDALKALETLDARKARVVELRFFGGLTLEEVAEALRISADTAQRDWKFAKTWLHAEIAKGRLQ